MEWIAVSSTRVCTQLRDRTQVCLIGRHVLYQEKQRKPLSFIKNFTIHFATLFSFFPLVAQMVKKKKNPMGKGMATQYSCPENFHGQRNLTVFSPWGCKESDRTMQLSTSTSLHYGRETESSN